MDDTWSITILKQTKNGPPAQAVANQQEVTSPVENNCPKPRVPRQQRGTLYFIASRAVKRLSFYLPPRMCISYKQEQLSFPQDPSPEHATGDQQLHLFSSKQGTVGFENQINKCLELAEYLYAKIKNREEFEMVFDGEVGCSHGAGATCFQKNH